MPFSYFLPQQLMTILTSQTPCQLTPSLWMAKQSSIECYLHSELGFLFTTSAHLTQEQSMSSSSSELDIDNPTSSKLKLSDALSHLMLSPNVMHVMVLTVREGLWS
jgi:hypothetical protein